MGLVFFVVAKIDSRFTFETVATTRLQSSKMFDYSIWAAETPLKHYPLVLFELLSICSKVLYE